MDGGGPYYLLGQLMEEQLGQAGDTFICVYDACGQLTDLTLDLHHVIEDQVGQDLQGRLAHSRGGVTQSGGEAK